MKSPWFRRSFLLAMALSIPVQSHAQNVVTDWDNIASTTIVSIEKEGPGSSSVWFAYVHLAMYDAVNAIDHQYRPYVFTTHAPAGASKDAAAVAAAHSILVSYFPDQQPSLDAQFTSSLGKINDTGANIAAGVTVGEQAAQALIAARANDGLLANVLYTPPVGPGFWQRTPPAFGAPVTPWLGQMVPFTMASTDQFLPDEGPTPLDSQEWIDDYNQVKTLGAINSAVRTPQQTEIGLFWTEHTGQQYGRMFRGLAAQQGLDTSETARLMAMLWTAYADSVIGCFNAKYHFSFWRPVTAIRAGGGNPALTADPQWTPLAATPAHPEYPAAHGCITGGVSTMLETYFGTPNLNFSADSKVTGTVHSFSNTHDLLTEVERARIYAGFHYHHSVIQGKVLGTKVAHQIAQNFFQPLK